MNCMDILEPIIRNAERNQPHRENDYTDSDGLLHCGVCHEPKQTIGIGILAGRKLPVMCACVRAEMEAREEEKRRGQVELRKSRCFSHREMERLRFDADNGRQPKLRYARAYCDNWQDNFNNGRGLLFTGGVGTGKSFAACCIANELCERDVPVKFINFAQVLADLQAVQNRNAYITELTNFPLLILDDVGIQRNTDYALEQLFYLIDSRCRSGKPLIVTTNISLAEIKKPEDMQLGRIYDRILSMCTPVLFEGESQRGAIAREKRSAMARQFREL